MKVTIITSWMIRVVRSLDGAGHRSLRGLQRRKKTCSLNSHAFGTNAQYCIVVVNQESTEKVSVVFLSELF